MKKLLSFVLVLVMGLSLVACGGEKVEEKSDLDAAAEYLYSMYKDISPASYSADYEVVAVVKVGATKFNVTWTADATEENVKIVPGETKTTIDVNNENPEDVLYKLTATLADAEGNTKSVTFERKTPAALIIGDGMSYAEIVDAAYKLAEGGAFEEKTRLFGTITKIDTAYSPDYKNITVTIAVEGKEDKPIQCYRLQGAGCDKLAVGDKITVEGIMKNYKGTIEFDAKCELLGVGVEVKDSKPILEAAYKLEDGMAFKEPTTLTGVISKIDTAYSPDYKNITVTIICDGDEAHPMMCYRLQGEGCDKLAVGDKITVTGIIKNYKGTIEFDAKCTLDKVH
jgi:hypothetical protein